MSSGANAISGFCHDLSDLEEDVQSYCASIQTSAPLAQLPRNTNSDMAKACVLIIRSDEADNVQKMMEKLRVFRARMDTIGSEAANRNLQQQRTGTAGVEAQKHYFKDLYGQPAGASNAGRAALPIMQTAMQDSSNTLMLQQRMLLLNMLLKSADQRIDDLIASLNGAAVLLQANAEMFRQLAVRCSDWMVSLEQAAR